MDHELLIRSGAVVAGLAALAGPWLVGVAAKVRIPALPQGGGKGPESLMKDAHTILEIASRLQQAGCDKGVALCQQLIDVMLQPKEPSK